LDCAVIAHHELIAAVARHAILDLIADDAQVIHMRVLDGKAEGRKRERPNVELTGRQRGDDRRRTFKPRRFRHIGAAEMGEQVFFLQH
jgi:ribosomal protein L19E